MGIWKGIAIGTGISVGAVGSFFGIRSLLRYSHRMNDLQTQLESIITVSIHSLNLEGLTIRIDTVLKNPSEGTLKIRFPFVKIMYNDSTIGSSKVVDQTIVLPKFGEAKVEGIMVNIPIFGMLTLAGAIYKLLTDNKTVPLLVMVRTIADLGWSQKTIDQTHKIDLKPLG